ncbi:glycosyltransferase [[Limnothrix rosea] IAM M-220]|uniref:glycosyltransferase n=1 Tax=[Limnothrix rosea] IAM M-220 TaxID=454133 RepID=UPI00095BE029|nr:glycosyltransferase [[Limnothrix rosea] IAM M-220]OKH18579.1 hypothetical protein NIES208_05055 [[Limnothrix rosea] IAM M-220]
MSKALKILFVSTSSGSQGGGELCLVYQGRALAKLGHQVTLWTSTHSRMDPLCEQFSEVGEVIRYDYTNTYDYKFRSLQHFTSIFKKDQGIIENWKKIAPDFIHLNKQNLEDGLDLVAALEYVDIPSIVFLHITQSASYLKAQYPGARDWVARYFLNRYAGPIVTTTNRLDQLCDFLGRNHHIYGIDNGATVPDADTYAQVRQEGRSRLQVDEDTFLIVGIGRLETQKRPDRFRDMAYKLQKQIPGSVVLWVGAGRLEDEWQAWVKENDIDESRFRRIGWQTNVFPYLAASDLYLHPAEFEGMPFSLLEAMAWNNPCVIMDSLSRELHYFNKDVAMIASDGSDDWMSKALDPGSRDQLSKKARSLIEQKFSIERMAQDYQALYLETLAADQ